MIDTLVYDMGNVLVPWNPRALALAGSSDPADAPILERALFGSPDWVQGDLGAFDEEQMYEAARARVPERLEGQLRNLCFHWSEWLAPIPGAGAFVRRAKAAGLRGYLLSNASNRFPESLAACFPEFSLLDGAVVSAREGYVKPDARLYQTLLTRYALTPERCFFIDDVPANIEGARRVGMDGAVFDGDFDKLAETLRARGVAL